MLSGVKFSLPSASLHSFFPKIEKAEKKDEWDSTENPFKFPQTDLFLFRSEEMKKKKEEKQLLKNLKIHEKTTFASRAQSRLVSVKRIVSDTDEAKESDEEKYEKSLKCDPSWILSVAKRCRCDRRSLKDYIAKKREIFLAQYTVAVKQEAIRTMEETAMEEERLIGDSEKKLEEDTIAFEEFLKENDRNSVEALKIAEQETRNKLDKNSEIRKATGEMMSITSDIARNEEILKEYLMYEEFLRELSPIEWQEHHQIKRFARRTKRKEKKHKEAILPALIKKTESKGTKVPIRTDSIKDAESKATKIPAKADSTKEMKLNIKPKLSISDKRPSTSRSPVRSPLDESDSEEEPDIYFTDPQQLLHIFTELEEQNLSLILNCQETHENLEEIKERSQIMQNKLKFKTDALKSHREKLLRACILEEEKAAELELRSRLFCFGEFNSQEQEKLIDVLNHKISHVYLTCIGESETTVSTINMLSSIERRIDELYELLEAVSKDSLEAAQKAKKKERRMRVREEKLRLQILHQEERLKRALARATADPKKQTGRKLMRRSAPPKTKQKTSEDDQHSARLQEEYRYFFTWQ
ncbi:coiled-coil domain-containing protein 38 isoform X2 [Rhinatrema bivittatum]|uniref:coiled-coil domain-containing protein 38 isoform X2 n=1 Tax=Rhinatrema bivittatum TaxID=194408 RepID=UPI00112CA174|nr:coiled-coil domain-containing protein 38 isoform X2 [Rhinatrema bivittatum]